MNDVKEICDAMLEGPEPPLRGSDEVLAVAQHAARRRDRFAVAGSGLTVVAVALGAIFVAPGLLEQEKPAQVEVAASGQQTAPAVAEVPAPALPTAEATRANGPQVLEILLAAVPDGYTGEPQFGADEATNTIHAQGDTAKKAPLTWGTSTTVNVLAGPGRGHLDAFIAATGKAAPTGDLCSAEASAQIVAFNGVTNGQCEVIVVNGVPTRVSTHQDAERGEVRSATRFLEGGFLIVTVSQGKAHWEPDPGVPVDEERIKRLGLDNRPKLDAVPLTVQQLAEIAANPAMLP